MKETTFKKSLSRALCLISLVCITFTASATTVNNDSINSLSRISNAKFGQIIESINEGVDPVNLNLKLNLDLTDLPVSIKLIQVIYNTLSGEDGMINDLKNNGIDSFDSKTLKKLKKQFTRRSNKEIKKVCEGDRQTQKELKHKIKKLLDGIQIKENQ